MSPDVPEFAPAQNEPTGETVMPKKIAMIGRHGRVQRDVDRFDVRGDGLTVGYTRISSRAGPWT